MERLCHAVRNGVYLIPDVLGFQESGALFGLPSEIALALSLTRRVRELPLNLPGLLFSQIWNGIDLLRRLCCEATPTAVTAEGT